MKFDFAPEGFDTANLMYLAAFGSGDPVTGVTEETTGSQILTVNIDTGEIKPFAYNKSGKPAGRSLRF